MSEVHTHLRKEHREADKLKGNSWTNFIRFDGSHCPALRHHLTSNVYAPPVSHVEETSDHHLSAMCGRHQTMTCQPCVGDIRPSPVSHVEESSDNHLSAMCRSHQTITCQHGFCCINREKVANGANMSYISSIRHLLY